MKLNIGCGTDYKDGFINIDGSYTLEKVDKVLDLDKESLLDHFQAKSVDFILANDVIEHHFHWQAIRLLTEFYKLLMPEKTAEIRVPDAQYIIESLQAPIEEKLRLLFGGQEISQGVDAIMDQSRMNYPQFFCHKYGWTMKDLKADLLKIGFNDVYCKRSETNFIAYATK